MDTTVIRALEMVRAIRDQIFEEIQHLSPDELKAFIAREASRVDPTTQGGRSSSDRPAA